MMSSGARHDIAGRIVGMLVFLAGVCLLAYVFYISRDLFLASPSKALNLTFTGDPKKDPQLAQIGSQFTGLLFRIGYLLIMAIAGSLIAQKGVNLYFCAIKSAGANAIPPIETVPPV